MSCCLAPSLNDCQKIIQLQNELSSARCEANYYKSLHQKSVRIREQLQFEHDQEKLKLKEKNREEIVQFENTIKNLQAKLNLRERQLFGKKGEKRAGKKDSEKERKPKTTRGGQLGSQSSSKGAGGFYGFLDPLLLRFSP